MGRLPSTKSFAYGATLTLALVVGRRSSSTAATAAIGRGEYGSHVWKSSDGGESWSDETGDLVTISMGAGVWYERDFYLVTAGEGVMVKREFGGGRACEPFVPVWILQSCRVVTLSGLLSRAHFPFSSQPALKVCQNAGR